MDETTLRANPFETYQAGDGEVIWFDPDLNAFLRGPAEPDGSDEATEYPDLASALRA